MTIKTQVDHALNAVGLTSLDYREVGKASWPSAFAVSDLAVASVGAACSELASLSGQIDSLAVDRRLASLWCNLTIQPQGWALPPVWDDIAGVYAIRDGFIRIHTNAPHHKAAALRALGVTADRNMVAAAIARWDAEALETVIVAENGCAAQMMSLKEWRAHPQGRAVNTEPLIGWSKDGTVKSAWSPGSSIRPLAGLKVLDLTRVLAGPICTRTLAGFGAEVLRIDPPNWSEPLVETEVTPGKRLATLDLKTEPGRACFFSLLKEADVLIHGYRNGALDDLELGATVRRAINPSLIDVALNAYGWTGPWSGRRGFDSLVQMSSGIAHRGMEWQGADQPVPLPVQALDFATGYLMAAAALRAIRVRLDSGQVLSARLSLARTSALLASVKADNDGSLLDPIKDSDLSLGLEQTDWGPARRIRFPVNVPMQWPTPARHLHSDEASWA